MNMFPRIIFAYMIAFQFILLLVGYFMYQDAPPDFHLADQLTMILLLVALATFGAGFMLPRLVAGKWKLPGAGTSHPLSRVISPYIVRLCLFEVCTVCGFVGAFLHQNWHPMLPFVAMGLVGTALSPPTETFFQRFLPDAYRTGS